MQSEVERLSFRVRELEAEVRRWKNTAQEVVEIEKVVTVEVVSEGVRFLVCALSFLAVTGWGLFAVGEFL